MSFFDLVPWRNKTSAVAGPPADAFARMRHEMDRVFDQFFSGYGDDFRAPAGWQGWVPAVDVAETDTTVTVRAEVPGVDPEHLDVSVNGDVLTISGQKEERTETKEKDLHRTECRYGAFRRSIALPAEVDVDSVSAEHSNGVLVVNLKKSPQSATRRIAIQTK